MPLRHLSLLLAIGWMMTLFYLSHQTGLDAPQPFAHSDKLYHATAYGLLGGLLLLSLQPKAGGFSARQILVCVAIASLYAVSDEFHQSFIPGREADWLDWLADTVGALVACLFIAQLSRQKMSSPS